MPPRRLRALIIGIAMSIIGPALGFIAYLGVALRTLHNLPTPSTSEAMARWQQIPGQMLLAMFPAGLGALCGAVGLFIVISTLVIHFLGAAADDPRRVLKFR